MRICPTCSSTAFEDMAICYGCLEPFEANAAASLAGVAGIQGAGTNLEFFSTEDELAIEEPSDGRTGAIPAAVPACERPVTIGGHEPRAASAAPACEQPDAFHFHIADAKTRGYDVYLLKKEGQELAIGQEYDSDNVSFNGPCEPWMLQVCFTQGQLWVKDLRPCCKAVIDGAELSGPRVLHPGDTIWAGGSKIEFIS